MVKYDERGICALKTGKDSKRVEEIMRRIDLAPFDDIDKIQMKGAVQNILKRSIALDTDSFSREIVANQLKETGLQVTTYESDLYNTQEKLSTLEADNNFHEQVIKDLKKRYYESEDNDEKTEILEQIRLEEEGLKKSFKLYNDFMNTRNKIRNAIDRKLKPKVTLELTEGSGFTVDNLNLE